jgi:hypothetical protein
MADKIVPRGTIGLAVQIGCLGKRFAWRRRPRCVGTLKLFHVAQL